MTRRALSKSVQRIYDYICGYSAKHGYPPTVREIGQAVHLRSPSTVHMHLRTLENLGYIKRDPNKPRAMEISHPEKAHVETVVSPSLPMISQTENDVSVALLPLVGRVAAGEPILAEQNIEEVFKFPSGLIGDDNSFLLRVKGESMVNIGIFDDDLIVVKETPQAQDGEVVVALLDDSATVKTYYKEENCVRLQPENDTMDPIYVKNPTILGRVTGLIRPKM